MVIIALFPLVSAVKVRSSGKKLSKSDDGESYDVDDSYEARAKKLKAKASETDAKVVDRIEYINSEGEVAYIDIIEDTIEAVESTSTDASGDVHYSADYDGSLPEDLTDNEKLEYMNENAEYYPSYLIYFAGKYPETIDYVYHYPEYKDYAPELDLTEEASGDEVPLLIQWDKRWGYIEFGNGWIGCSACGAVCMSMAALYLTGNTKYDPVYISKYAIDNHYYIGGSGITSGFMTNAPYDFGMYGAQLSKSESNMIAALENGKVIICSVAPGDFTYRGHYIVIAGYKDGKFKVNDPNSYKNSEKLWTYQELSWQITQMWSMEKAN